MQNIIATPVRGNVDLVQRILTTLALLIVFRVGAFIPIPCINSQALSEIATRNQSGVLGMFNVLSGGSLGRMSIFALAIMPYITSSIIIQLLSIAYKPLENLKKDGESGRQKINQITRYLTILLAIFQSYGVAVSLENMSSSIGSVVMLSGLFFKFSTVVTLVVGTVFLMWLGEQISSRGIGNGSSLIIFAGIVSGLPSAVISLFELSRKGIISYLNVLVIFSVVFSIMIFIVFFEKSFRKVMVQNPHKKTQQINQANYIPIKVNVSGVIPPMFASSILLFPITIANFYQGNSKFIDWFVYNFARGKPLFLIFYVGLVFFFGLFYAAVIFNSEEIANNLKKSGSFIPGLRPGKPTAEYFDYLISRVTVLGSLYLSFVCIVPEIIMNKISSFTLGGASILICVNVIIETFSQIQSYTINRQYDTLVKKIKFH
jgi:preprotein translocase subunit SecY